MGRHDSKKRCKATLDSLRKGVLADFQSGCLIISHHYDCKMLALGSLNGTGACLPLKPASDGFAGLVGLRSRGKISCLVLT